MTLALPLLATLVLGCGQETATPEPTRTVAAWPQWRGPLGTGFAPDATPPLTWSEDENVRWRTPLPGKGHSTPVLTQGLLFLTAALPVGEQVDPRPESAPGWHDNLRVTQRHGYVALAVEADTGEIAWQRQVAERFPPEGGHVSGSYASASPVTDGERLYASFGSVGVFCFDLNGALLWERAIPPLATKHGHGEGSSPTLHGDTLFVNSDHEGESLLLALDTLTGEERWRVARDEVTSWASPIVVELSSGPQLVVSGTRAIRGYDPADGSVIWRCSGMANNVVATPVFGDGHLFAGSSYEKQALLALRLEGARGPLDRSDHVAWYERRTGPYVPSPLLYDDALYVLNHYQGFLSRFSAPTGERARQAVRLSGIRDVYASPLGAADRIYIVDRSGETVVLSHEAEPRILARNRLDDSFSACPVAVGPDLFLRGEDYLYCLREE